VCAAGECSRAQFDREAIACSKDKGNELAYAIAMASNAAAYVLFHHLVYATGSAGHVTELVTLAMAVASLDATVHGVNHAFEMRPAGLTMIHWLYHVVGLSMAVFYYTFLSVQIEVPQHAIGTVMGVQSWLLVGLGALAWCVVGMVYYSERVMGNAFLHLSFGPVLPKGLEEAGKYGMTLVPVFAVGTSAVLSMFVRSGEELWCNYLNVLLPLSVTFALNAVHPSFELRPYALYFLHIGHHLVAALAVTAVFHFLQF
jgi:hypothetical protein